MVMTTPMVLIGHGDGYGAPLPVFDFCRRPDPSPARYAIAIYRTEPIPNTGCGMKGNCSRRWGRMPVVSNLRLYQEVRRSLRERWKPAKLAIAARSMLRSSASLLRAAPAGTSSSVARHPFNVRWVRPHRLSAKSSIPRLHGSLTCAGMGLSWRIPSTGMFYGSNALSKDVNTDGQRQGPFSPSCEQHCWQMIRGMRRRGDSAALFH